MGRCRRVCVPALRCSCRIIGDSEFQIPPKRSDLSVYRLPKAVLDSKSLFFSYTPITM